MNELELKLTMVLTSNLIQYEMKAKVWQLHMSSTDEQIPTMIDPLVQNHNMFEHDWSFDYLLKKTTRKHFFRIEKNKENLEYIHVGWKDIEQDGTILVENKSREMKE